MSHEYLTVRTIGRKFAPVACIFALVYLQKCVVEVFNIARFNMVAWIEQMVACHPP